jgi:hypothetical protein
MEWKQRSVGCKQSSLSADKWGFDRHDGLVRERMSGCTFESRKCGHEPE